MRARIDQPGISPSSSGAISDVLKKLYQEIAYRHNFQAFFPHLLLNQLNQPAFVRTGHARPDHSTVGQGDGETSADTYLIELPFVIP
jgi:hypothetical protein